MNKVLFSHNSDEWSTPDYLYNELDKEFCFNLDVAASENNKKCDKFFSLSDSALAHSWYGYRVFCNPPYSNIKKFVKKAYEENDKNNVLSVLLLPARTDTEWFHEYVYHKAEIRFLKGRLKFNDSKNNAPFPSMIVIYR